ncbi:MAG: hypothetical protein KAR79_06225 [Simkaniaceae bacterium]|nr:hypothetical protein [Simkaniaceae bacterium]
MNTPIQIADTLKKEADILLYEKGLYDLLSKYGKVSFVGSYALDLLAWRDIDLELQMQVPHSISDFMDLAKDLAEFPGVKRITFLKDLHLKYKDFPKGLCMGVYIDQWKIDIWDMDAQEITYHQGISNAYKQKLTPDLRELIVSCKQQILTKEGRTPKSSGVYLLEAALTHGLRDPKEIFAYLKKHGVAFAPHLIS